MNAAEWPRSFDDGDRRCSVISWATNCPVTMTMGSDQSVNRQAIHRKCYLHYPVTVSHLRLSNRLCCRHSPVFDR